MKFFRITLISLFLFFTVFSFVSAQGVDLSCNKNSNAYPWCGAGKTEGVAGLVNRFYTVGFGIAGLLAFGVLVYAGIQWTFSGVVTQKIEAREWLYGALWGIALLATGYLILNTINPELVELDNPNLSSSTIQREGPVIGSLCDSSDSSSCPSGSACVTAGRGYRCEVIATAGSLQSGQRCGVSGSASCDSARGLTCQLTYSRNNIQNPTYNRTDPSQNQDYYTCR